MDTKSPIILTLLFIVPALSANPPRPDYCDPSNGPEVRFPFRLADRAPGRRGYPGFDLYCNSDNQTILRLPESGEFLVDHIDYSAQAVFINDPDSCLPARILNFSLSGSRFRGVYTRNYTFLNCSTDYVDYTEARFMPLMCLSGRNYTVVAASSRTTAEVPPTCRRIASVLVPMRWTVSNFYWSSMDLMEDLELVWSDPECWGCENEGGICGLNGDSGLDIGCFRPAKSRGLPRGARYGLIIGVGIPGLVCIIGLACYACGMLRNVAHRRQLNSDLPVTFSDQRPSIRSASGLDQPTIESYPTKVLGESLRLPKPSDGTCPICLSDYQAKETLRSIPECNHYFHADCIDEWLKLNGTCPLCRNSPDSTTPCSSSLSISSSPSPSTTPSSNLDHD
ncbi:RING/U-box superfamily protein [Striga hermonthica]|uniref:RING-type E3 ubiquitin transferase n=1 Tax=Striga hermonthica TaxID=68872 RepID=A0A9N7MPY0_STRHE|nr:RING/U-box superfamily protein [Striga hermonthica]